MLILPAVSVIVPAYNVEKYLAECLDSLINQTFKDIEIICVNDGSTDSTLDIFNDYAAKDSRIKVFSQENKGVSGARNAAMDHITGKYTYFMDSDDVLDINALETLYNIAEDKQLDFAIFKIMNFDDETREKEPNPYYDMEYLKDAVGENVFSHRNLDPVDVFKIAVTPASKFYRSDLISDIRFPMCLIFEDNAFFIETFLKAERVYFYDEYLSNKRVRADSITHSPNESFMDYISISKILIDHTKNFGFYEQYKEGLFYKTILNIYLKFKQVDTPTKAVFFEKIKEYFLSKKEEYDNDPVFQGCDEKIREIFYSAIESQNAREYELSIRCIDLSEIIEKKDAIIEQKSGRIRAINRDKDKLINNSRHLSDKLNEVSFEYRNLKKQNKQYKSQINDLKYVNEQLMGSTSWKVTKPIRFVGDAVKK